MSNCIALPSHFSSMDRIIKHAKRSISKFSLAALSLNVLLGSAVSLPAFTPIALAVAPTCTVTLNGGDNIENAINAAAAGSVICLNPGTYTPASTINVTKAMTVVRTGCDMNTISTRSAGNPAVEAIVDGNNLANIFSIEASNVTLACLEITDATGDIVYAPTSGPIKTGVVVQNNIVHDSSGDEGIQLKKTSGAIVKYNDVYDVAGDGINLSDGGTTDGQILQNRIHNSNSSDGSIYIYNASNTTIDGNLIYAATNNDAIKLGIEGGGNATGSVGGTISNNVIVTGSQDAISVYMSDVTVSGNKIKNSTSANGAIYVAYASNNIDITDNLVTDNSTTGIKIGGAGIPTNVSVNDNCIEGNSAGVVFTGTVPNLNAENNWWGDVSGPSGSGPGTGDSVSANVDFSPFNAAGCTISPIIDGNEDGIPDGADDPLSDADADGVPDATDNCPTVANADQLDSNTDGIGDACSPASSVTVTIAKYMNGVHATAGNTDNASFNMTAVYNASNIGSGSDPYVISATGNGTPETYEAQTIALASGADYSTYETISTPCTDATPFDLVGYSTGDSLAAAEAAPVSMIVPAFTGLTSDKFVIVWNKTCPPVPTHLTPADGSTLTTAQLDKIDWSDVATPALPMAYFYEVATTDTSTNPDGSFVNPVYESAALSDSEIVTAGTGEGTYHWHVRAVDAAGNSSAWSAPWTVTVSNAAVDTTPPVVEILGYRNQTNGTYDNGPAIQACGTTTASSFIAFEWQEVGTDISQPLSYEYKILSGPAGVGYTENHSDTHHNGGIPAEGTYTIQITPTDAALNVGAPVTCTMTYDADYVAPVACNVSDTDLIAHWKLDEAASATVAEDATTNDNDGAVMGATSAATPATTPVFINTGSYDFDGVNDSIDMGSNVGNFTVADSFSISAWINPALDFQNHAIYGNTWSSPGYLLRVTDQNKIRFILAQNGSVYEGMDSGVLTPGWHHVTGVWDGANVKVYVDGVDASMTPIANGTVSTITTSAHTFIGQTGQIGSAHYFDGMIDDVRVYGDALSESEIAALAAGQCQGGTPPSSSSASSASSASSESSSDASESSSESSSSSAPVIVACTTSGLDGYWPFNEGTDTTTFDMTGMGHDGALQNGTAWASGNPAISPNPFGLAFDGTDDMVSVTDSNAFNYGTQDFTVSTFVRTTEGNRSVLGNFSAGHKGWGLYIYNTNQVNFFGYGTAGNNDAAKPAVVLDGDWHHITGVYKRSGNDLTIETYVDGVLVGSSTATVGDISANSTLYFGQYMPQPGLNGSLDDVRIYDRALSPSEVANLAGGCSNPVASSSSSESSSSMSSEGASSSESFESFQSFGLSTPEVEPGNGSFRGSRTNILGGVINFIRGRITGTAPGGFGGIAPGGFGGASDLPYTVDEKNIICTMKRAIPTDAKLGIWEWVASVLSEQMNHSEEDILESLRDSSFCDFQATAKTKVATATTALPFLVSSAGYPLSENPTWNACVTGKVTLQDIRNNPDKDKHGRGRSCATYHTGNMWTHPDLDIFFTWNSKTKKITLPDGYVINQQKVTL